MRRNRVDIEDQIESKAAKIRKKSELSLKAIRQLKTLNKYFVVDEVNRIITIPIHYEKLSEIADTNFSNDSHPFIKQEFLESISSKLHSIPIEFNIDLDIKIKDYEGYDSNEVIDSIKDSFEIFHYDVGKERTRSNLKVAILIILGVTIFAWLFYLCSKKLIGQSGDPTHDTVHELIYTVAAVLLWEAVYIIFLPDDTYKEISYSLLWRVRNIRLVGDNNKTLAFTSSANMTTSWMIETKKERRARYFLLLAGTTLVCLSIIKIRDIVEMIIADKFNWMTYLAASFSALMVIFGVLAGIGATSYYRDKGPFKKLVLFIGILASIFYLIETISYIVIFITQQTYELKAILGAIAYAIVMIIYTSCAFMLRNKKIKAKKSKKN